MAERGNICSRPGVILIAVSYQTAPTDHPDAWAYAMPCEGTHIVVFWDRILRKVPRGRAPVMMAHVLVHEITHSSGSQSALGERHDEGGPG